MDSSNDNIKNMKEFSNPDKSKFIDKQYKIAYENMYHGPVPYLQGTLEYLELTDKLAEKYPFTYKDDGNSIKKVFRNMVEEVFYYLEYKKIREMFIFENNKEWLEYENNLRIFIQNIQYKYKEKIGDLSLPYQLSKKTYGSILYSRYTEIPKKEIYEKSNRNRNRLQKIQYKG